MPRLLFLVSSARELLLADGSAHVTGYFAEEALTPYERFVAAGVDVDVVTPDGRAPFADPYGLDPIFHYPDRDEDFLASVTRTFARDVDGIRLTLAHRTELGLIGARRVFLALCERALSPSEARGRVSTGARLAWRQDRGYVDVLVGEALGDPLSRAEIEQAVESVLADSRRDAEGVMRSLAVIPGFRHPLSLSEMTSAEMAGYDGLFAPGGHGPMVDLADNPDVGRLIAVLHEKGCPIAALCHGPALLLSGPAKPDGQWLFDGYRVTAFTDEEERQTPPGQRGMAWLLESALRNAGAVFDDARSAWTSHVVADRNVITAQNPNSAAAAAAAVLSALGASPVGDRAGV